MKSFSIEKENIIKNKRNLFRIKKGLYYTGIKDIRKLFGQEKKN